MMLKISITECKTALELLTKTQSLCFDSPYHEHRSIVENRWVFRGQASYKWKLTPSAYRGSRRDPKQQVEGEVDEFQGFLANCDEAGIDTAEYSPDIRAVLEPGDGHSDAVRSTASFRFGENSWPQRRELHNLALAQHNGLKTRLLDWSKDPYIAAYFAASDVARASIQGRSLGARKLSVWGLDTALLWNLNDATADSASVKLVFAANSRNRRLFAQRGCFTLVHCNHMPRGGIGAITLHSVLERELKRLNAEMAGLKSTHPKRRPLARFLKEARATATLRQFNLPYKETKNLLRLLSSRGISASSMFADLEGATKAIAEQSYWLD